MRAGLWRCFPPLLLLLLLALVVLVVVVAARIRACKGGRWQRWEDDVEKGWCRPVDGNFAIAFMNPSVGVCLWGCK